MTPADAAKILTLISVFDNRQFDDATARVWADALDGLDLSDCLDAVRVYYRQTKTWLMPSDLRQQARSILMARKELAQAENERLAIDAANTNPQIIAERVELLRQAVANACVVPTEPSPHPKQDTGIQRAAKAHQCPWCQAPVRQPCANTATGQPSHVIHEARLVAAGLTAPAVS
jgi:hypothetical protein